MSILIRDTEIEGRPHLCLRIQAGRITEMEPHLEPARRERVIDASGGATVPGLHDHHVHVRALAAAASSLVVGPPSVKDAATFAARLRDAARGVDDHGWIRAIGYHESVAGEIDAYALDRIVRDQPVRVQHRSGAMWMLNSEAMRRLGVSQLDASGVERGDNGEPTGRLWRLDRWLAAAAPVVATDIRAVGEAAARRGVTGFTDADPERSEGDVTALADQLEQRLHLMGPLGFRLPERIRDHDPHDPPRITAGPHKILLDDLTLPSLDDLTARVAAAHAESRPVAVHCVTRAQLVLTLAAIEAAGAYPDDRIEHGSVIPPELFATIRGLGLTVVTQPVFVDQRGDAYVADVDQSDLPHLYRCASLRQAGVRLAAGTDAPFGDADPWRSIRAAIVRETTGGRVLGAGERLSPTDAFALFLGRPDQPAQRRQVRRGEPADLCVLAEPLAASLATCAADPSAVEVRATIAAGEVLFLKAS